MFVKGVLLYLQLALIVASLVLGFGVFQFCLNLHSTIPLFLGVLGLVGLPIAVAYIFKRIVNSLN